MKKILLIFVLTLSLVACSQTQTFTGVKTFTSPPKFLNLQYSETNRKFLTINASNQLMWSSAAAITPATPTFQQVLAAGKQSVNNSTAHFSLVGNNISANYFTGYTTIADTNTGNKSVYGSDGFTNSNNDGRYAELGFAQGIELKTNAAGGTASIKTTNVLSNIDLELPNTSGTLITDAPSDGTSYNRKDGGWVVAGGGGTPTFQEILDSSREWTGTNGLDKVSFNPVGGGGETLHTMYHGSYNTGTITSQTSSRFWINSYDSSNNIISDIKVNRQSLLLGQTNFGPYSGLRIVGDEGIIFESGSTNDGTQVALNSSNITGSRNQQFTDASGNIPIINTTAPASATATGKVGEIRVTSAYIYVCTATNTWVRSAVATW